VYAHKKDFRKASRDSQFVIGIEHQIIAFESIATNEIQHKHLSFQRPANIKIAVHLLDKNSAGFEWSEGYEFGQIKEKVTDRSTGMSGNEEKINTYSISGKDLKRFDHGFSNSDFHWRCDGISNTITIIQTTEDFIFGGFTPIAWDSTSGYKADTSGRSFLFSVKNPHNRDFGRIGLKDPRYAIYCSSSTGPMFGNGYDIYVANGCNANTSSYTHLGCGYVNNTSINEYQVFTGKQHFTVKEIEVFTLID
jgi:hypothetical protein